MGKKKIAQKQYTSDTTKRNPAMLARALAKKKIRLQAGRVYINASYNNTIVTVTDMQGNVITWASAGSVGFTGPRKATPFASSKIIAVLAEQLKPTGLKDIEVVVKGVGSGRDSAIRSLINQGFNVLSLRDATPIPHNGPRPPKPRRV